MRAGGLVCLGAGAGLIRADLRQVRGSDVSCPLGRRDRGGARGAAAGGTGAGPLPRAAARLRRVRRGQLVAGGADPARRNVTTPLVSALAGGTGLPRLDTSRLRATWLRDCAELLGLAAFMHAAGITCSQRLGDLLATLEPGSEAGAVALLGGRPR